MQRCVALGLCWRRGKGGAESVDEDGRIVDRREGVGRRGREEMIREGGKIWRG
jgi:hypothetical protein